MGLAPIKDPKVAALIEEAAGLARANKANEARLDEIKGILRKKADAVMAKRPAGVQDNMVEFDSAAGTCTVIFVDETPRLASGADPERLMEKFAGVGGIDWTQVFKKRWLLASGWQEVFGGLPKPVQRAIEKLVDWEPSTPRVVLPK